MNKAVTTEETRYAHDCEECIFLGQHTKHDLYFCSANPTVIARYGTDGDYISGIAVASRIPELAIALTLAINAGLITTEEITAITNP